MDPEDGLENELDNSGGFEEGEGFEGEGEGFLDDLLGGEGEGEGETTPEERTEVEAEARIEDEDLPPYASSDLTEAEREQFFAGLGDDALATIDALIERRVQARLSSNAYANIHLAREAQKNPDFFGAYGAQTQAILSQMKPETAATKQGVHLATLGAIARKVMQTGDLAGTLIEAGKALQKGRALPAGTTETKAATKPLPPEARTPSPSVGKRPAAGARGNGRASAERITDALAEMTGTSSARARRFFEEGD